MLQGVTDAVFSYGTYQAVLRANKEHTYLYFMDYVNANEIFPIPYDARVGTYLTHLTVQSAWSSALLCDLLFSLFKLDQDTV